jgi:hypothetical protein
MARLATQVMQLCSNLIEWILTAAAGREQFFKKHGLLHLSRGNATCRAEVPSTV